MKRRPPTTADKLTRDLTDLARAGQVGVALYRDREVKHALEALRGRRSTLFVGPSGVGKTSAIHALAVAVGEQGGRLLGISTSVLMADTMFLGQWQSRVETLLGELRAEDAVLYLSDIWNLAGAGTTIHDSASMLDAVKPHVEAGHLRLVGEAAPELLARMMQVPGFVNLFEQVGIRPLDAQLVPEVLRRVALGADAGEPLDDSALRALLQLTTRFWPQRPQPGPAIELFRRVHHYRAEKKAIGEGSTLDEAFVEKVFSIYTGLPRFVLSRAETRPAREIRGWFHERIVGQVEAIEAVVETIALFKAGLQDPQRPLGTFLFVGPTGVGKTELARATATYLFGSPTRLLRFDMSEFKDYSAFEMLVGDPKDRTRPARLLDPVRSQPFQVILLDEIEKAHPNLWDLLLQVLDDGRLTPPAGQAVDFRNTIVIATSNAGWDEGGRSVGFGAGDARAPERVRRALEATFRPELLNRFQHIVVFHPLSRDHVRHIARRELERVLRREGITGRNLLVEVDDDALDLVIDRGFDPRWGARALKRELQRRVVLPLAVTLMEREVFPGALLRVTRRGDDLRTHVVETESAREARRSAQPVVTAAGERRDRAGVRAALATAAAALVELARDLDETRLRQEHERLLARRNESGFFRDPAEATRALRDIDRVAGQLARLDRLRDHQGELEQQAAAADTHDRLQAVASSLERLETALAAARRELVTMGAAGTWDALVEIRPVGDDALGRKLRDLLHETYVAWARERRFALEVLAEPLADREPIFLSISGPHAFGYLRLEAGLHRLRDRDDRAVARVRVAPWTEAERVPSFGQHAALKATGQLGGRVRSRLSCDEGLTLQNARTLNENRQLMTELLGSWLAAPADGDAIVRRYDLSPWFVRDELADLQTGRSDVLRPGPFHQLLCRRIDQVTADAPAPD